MLIRRSILFFFVDNLIVFVLTKALNNVVVALYNFGPLFLAMDRCLVVAFPHNFLEHERKLRVAKGVMVLVVAMLSLTFSMVFGFGDPEWTMTGVLGMLAGLAAILQIIAIVGLYTVIVTKVVMSDRNMKSSRHSGNK